MQEQKFECAPYGELTSYCWPVDGEPRAIVQLVHGLGEHCARYQALAERLNNAGIEMHGIDLPGHGKSPGQRAHIRAFSDFEQVVLSLRSEIATRNGSKPVFLLGHSMGGLISTRVLQQAQERYAGAILSGPALASPLQPSAVQMAVIRILSRLLPTMGAMQLDASGVSRDLAVVREYESDPLVNHGKVSARLVRELFKSMQQANSQAATISLPMLIMHGGEDSMAAPEGARGLYAAISSSDKQLEILEGLYHEIFNEPEGPTVQQQVVDWILSRLP